MAGEQFAILLLVLNFCMFVMILGIGGRSMNTAIDHGFIIGPGFDLPAHFSPIHFPMGNAATGFFVIFALLAGGVGLASVISGCNISWALSLSLLWALPARKLSYISKMLA